MSSMALEMTECSLVLLATSWLEVVQSCALLETTSSGFERISGRQ